MSPSSPTVAGIDRWRKGWILAIDKDNTLDGLELKVAPTIFDAFELLTTAKAIAIDMPIGLVERGTRAAERELRERLGRARSSVFISPTRAALEAASHNDATLINRSLDGPGISAQSWGLAKSIRECRHALTSHPEANRWWETHPESAFAELNGREPMDSKKSARGVMQRLSALEIVWPGIGTVVSNAPPRVPVDDVLDALIAAWSARRIVDGTAVLVGPAGRDDEGFPNGVRI